ncbi:hypothetical protein FB451DRAFT_1061692 [Mycena latifolia]|nr:hypothetical protein FB451DRAFT_1061692 [Mycena latifolia]
MSEPPSIPPSELLEAFRQHFHQYNRAVDEAVSNQTDEVVLQRLSDDLTEYTALVEKQALDASHHGRPTVIETVHTGQRGRPRIVIDPQFLQFAHDHRSTSGISRFLGIARGTPQPAPFDDSIPGEPGDDARDEIDSNLGDEMLDPTYVIPETLPAGLDGTAPHSASTGELSTIADWELDSLLLRLRTHFCHAGISMLDGMLCRLGHRVQRERIRESLARIDPVHRVFQRIRIRRRHYHVAGPNLLWHHDGQHGKSIHNVRIERLWVDITAQVGATWSDHFTLLELHHGLDINNVNHTWLLHYIFLPTINDQLTFFAQAWNQHRIQIRNGPNRSPADMFGFDTLVHGAHGHALVDDMPEEELEVYGVDWEGLQDDAILQSQRSNNTAENGWSSWIGRSGPPDHLNEVPVESPTGPFGPQELEHLDAVIAPWQGLASNSDIVELWTNALACCCTMNANVF